MHDVITVIVPIPPRFCNPNNKSRNWRANNAHKKQALEEAEQAAYISVYDLGPQWKKYRFPWTEVWVQVTWYHPTEQFRDRDNITSSLKSTMDGLTRAGLLADDKDVHWHDHIRKTDRKNPRVEITIEAVR